MSVSRRGLVSRAHINETVGSSPRAARNRNAESTEVTSTLPPYEPPTCPLTPSSKQALVNLGLGFGPRYAKYKSDIDKAIKIITTCTTEGNDRLYERKDELERAAKRREKGAGDEEKTGDDREIGLITASLERKVEDMTKKAEKALRDLIDYKVEVGVQQDILQEVVDNIPTSGQGDNTGRRQTGRRLSNVGSDENEESMEVDEEETPDPPAANEAILSPTELLKKAKEDYIKSYIAQTMHARYFWNLFYILTRNLTLADMRKITTTRVLSVKSTILASRTRSTSCPPRLDLVPPGEWFKSDGTT